MKAHHHEPSGRDAIEDGLSRLDRLCRLIIKDGRPIRVLQARRRVMGDVTICMNWSLPEVNKIAEWNGECPGAGT
jgi:hypothetical protein